MKGRRQDPVGGDILHQRILRLASDRLEARANALMSDIPGEKDAQCNQRAAESCFRNIQGKARSTERSGSVNVHTKGRQRWHETLHLLVHVSCALQGGILEVNKRKSFCIPAKHSHDRVRANPEQNGNV